MLKKRCIFLTLLFFIGIGSYLSGTYYYKLKMIQNHKDYYKIVVQNLPETVFLLESKKLERRNENIFIENIHFYNLTTECMKYYGTESIDDYVEIQKLIFKRNSFKDNYKLSQFFKIKKEEFIKAIKNESLNIVK